jgi:phosphate transport system substrate-binding protein
MASGSTAVKILPVVPYNGIDAEFPTQQKVTSNKYPMPRPCFAYVNRTPGLPLDPAISEFLHFVLSREGQSTVAEVGLLPAPPEFLDIARVRLDR